MSSGCGDVLSLADLQTAKKHQIVTFVYNLLQLLFSIFHPARPLPALPGRVNLSQLAHDHEPRRIITGTCR